MSVMCCAGLKVQPRLRICTRPVENEARGGLSHIGNVFATWIAGLKLGLLIRPVENDAILNTSENICVIYCAGFKLGLLIRLAENDGLARNHMGNASVLCCAGFKLGLLIRLAENDDLVRKHLGNVCVLCCPVQGSSWASRSG